MQTIYQKVIAVLFTAFAVFIVCNYFIAYPIPGLWIKLFELTMALVFVSSLIVLGKKILKLFKFQFSSIENTVFSFGVGLAVYIFITFFAGIAGLYYRSVFYVLVFLPMVIFHKDLVVFLKETLNSISSAFRTNWSFSKLLLVFVTTVSVLLTFICCFAPPTFYDSLTYHLALPALYINSKKIFYVPFNMYSHFPQNAEMLYTIALLVCDEILPNLMTFSIYIATLVAVFSFSQRYFNETSAIVALFLFSTVPTVMLLSASSYVEPTLAFFTLLTVYSFVLYLQSNSMDKTRYIVLCGFFSGLAFGTKYTGIITPTIITLLLLLRGIKNKSILQGLKHCFLLDLTMFIVFLPWALKNVVNVGNPVFPFLYNYLGYRNIPWNNESARGYFEHLIGYVHRTNLLQDLISLPYNIAVAPQKFGGGADILGDLGWIMFFLAIPLLLFTTLESSLSKGPEMLRSESPHFLMEFIHKLFPVNWLGLYSLGHFAIWFVTKPVLRFLYPLLPVISIIAGYSIITCFLQLKVNPAPQGDGHLRRERRAPLEISENFRFVQKTNKFLTGRGILTLLSRGRAGLRGGVKMFKLSVAVTIAFLTISNFIIYFFLQDVIQPFRVAIGIESREEYLTKKLRFSPYNVFKYINTFLDDKDKVFFVGEQRSFYCNKNFIAANVFAPNPLIDWSNSSKDYKELVYKLQQEGITHILYNKSEGERLRVYGIFDFSYQGEKNWQELISNSKLVFSSNDVYLYALNATKKFS